MDCEKFEPLLLDELYDELDELTSAAVKRHVSGCARCAGILNGMRATRRVVSLPMEPLPAGLEDRIFAAAKEAQKVVPIRSRMSRALSVAGSWAMRPQTAMAAVFLLMIGTSAFLIRSKNYASRESAVSVTVEGSPAPMAPVAQSEALDDTAAAAAHGPSGSNVTRPPVPAASAVAMGEPASNGPVDRLTLGDGRDKPNAKADALGSSLDDSNAYGGAVAKDSKGYATPPMAIAPAPTTAPITNAAAPGGAAPYDYPSQQIAKAPSKRSGAGDTQDPFDLGTAAYRARNYAEATKQFDAAARSGDLNAELRAAESTREGQGCAAALGRYDQLAAKAANTWIGNEASLKAARCQIAMGQLDPARDRLNRLASVPSHHSAAQQALGELNQVAGRKAGSTGGGAAAAAPARAAAPRSPMRAPSEAQEKRKVDTASGF